MVVKIRSNGTPPSRKGALLFIAVVVVLLNATILARNSFWYRCDSRGQVTVETPPSGREPRAVNSATGRLFKGEVIRKFDGPVAQDVAGNNEMNPENLRASQAGFQCAKWR